ncbi:MAG TPA: ATP-binding protein [Candidatus Saccharimonadales bacterium]|nr:ATP-binding protein [Candidatus Saccharimonadales bacterium]
MFKAVSLRVKLISCFLLLAFLIAGVSYYQLRSIQYFNSSFIVLVDGDYARLAALNELKLTSTEIRDQSFEYQQEVFEGAPGDSAATKASLRNLIGSLQRSESRYATLVRPTGAYAGAATVQQISDAVDDVAAKSLAVVNATATPNQKLPEAQEDALVGAHVQLQDIIDKTVAAEQKGAGAADQDVDNTVANLLHAIVAVAFAAILLAVGLGLFVSSWISRAISKLRRGAERIANGDFSRPIAVAGQDEIAQVGEAFNRMAERLKEAYRRQATSQQRDEAMLQSMGEGLIALDESGKILLINEVALRYFNLPDQAAAQGKPVEQIYDLYEASDKEGKTVLPPASRPAYRVLQTGEKINEVYASRHADGRMWLLNIAASPVRLGDKIIGVITVLRDVTHEKEVDRMKTEFISLASHQLRTPLSAIKWYSEMLVAGDAGKLEGDQLDFAINITESTERMIALVNALLNISRIESGRIMVDPKPTDLGELVSGIIADLKGKTEEKQQNMIISVHAELPKINLDPRLIGQVYLNLLTNAIKYTPKGGEISVFISRKGEEIISQVTDNGYGIPKEQQSRLFQKFFRASNAVKVETDGTGLGLYLIKAVIESSGGKIWFKSEEGKGSTFWFSIPASGMKAKAGEVTLDI